MLNELRLEGNRLASLAPNAFARLNSLRVLHLEQNEISLIRPNAFNGLRKLVELHLNDNRITPPLNLSLIEQTLGNDTLGESDELRRTINELRRRLTGGASVNKAPNNLIGDVNGLVNSPVNSLVNGHVNGRVNVQVSDHLNGHVNSFLNGQMSGLVSGRLNGGVLTDDPVSRQSALDQRSSGDLSALHLSNFNDLKLLDLSNNPLFALSALNSPFSGTHPATKANASSQLDTLLLNNCSLLALDAGSFSHLTNLVKLDLSSNLLSVSVAMGPIVWESL